MTIEAAINIILNKIQIDVRLCTDKDIEEMQEALYMAISALRAQQELSSDFEVFGCNDLYDEDGGEILLASKNENEPLTLNELLEMDKEPIYIVGTAETIKYQGWEIVEKAICGTMHFRPLNRSLQIGNYGKTWLAYRRNPEEV